VPQLDALGTKLLATRLRTQLRQGHPADSWFMDVVNRLTDRELVEKYLNHSRAPGTTEMTRVSFR